LSVRRLLTLQQKPKLGRTKPSTGPHAARGLDIAPLNKSRSSAFRRLCWRNCEELPRLAYFTFSFHSVLVKDTRLYNRIRLVLHLACFQE